MGGKLEITSSRDNGTAVIVTLPHDHESIT
jgi:signal transduction histidine kinase